MRFGIRLQKQTHAKAELVFLSLSIYKNACSKQI